MAAYTAGIAFDHAAEAFIFVTAITDITAVIPGITANHKSFRYILSPARLIMMTDPEKISAAYLP